MKFFVCAVLLAVCAVSISAQDTDADTEANKALIKQLHDVLKDETKTPEEKKTKVQETLQNLKGTLKAKIDTLLANMKTSIANIKDPQAKEVATKMEQMFENGELFDNKEKVKATMDAQLATLTDDGTKELHALKMEYKLRIENDFKQYKNLKP